jgi:aspartate-semialdehyde dehydrogenase
MSEAARRFDVAVVGATGLVGEALLTALDERAFPVERLYPLAGDNSAEGALVFANRSRRIRRVADFDFGLCQLVFFCAPASVSATQVERALAAGCRVIDLSAYSRLRAPLLIADLDQPVGADQMLLATPSAPALQLATVLAPLQRLAGLVRVNVTTLLAVSARGRAGVTELAGQTARLLNMQPVEHVAFPAQIGFNLLAAFDAPGESGYTHEELQLGLEVSRVLDTEGLSISACQLFASVFHGHTQIVEIEFREPLSLAAARQALVAAPGLRLLDDDEQLSPVDSIGDGELICVGRLAQSAADPRRLSFCSVADNVRKGAAVNRVAVAENLIKSLP